MWKSALVECPITMDVVWMVMIRCCHVTILFYCMCGFGVALGDDRSHMGGSDDKYLLVMYVWDIV